MSPYRLRVKPAGVIVSDSTPYVLAAMLCKSDDISRRTIRIVQKIDDGLSPMAMTAEELAYSQCSKSRSVVCDQYRVGCGEVGYYIDHYNDPWYRLPNRYRTLDHCMRAAMHDYCEIHGLEVIEVL